MSKKGRFAIREPLSDPSLLNSAVEQVKSWTSFVSPYINAAVTTIRGDDLAETDHDDADNKGENVSGNRIVSAKFQSVSITSTNTHAHLHREGERGAARFLIINYEDGYQVWLVDGGDSVQLLLSHKEADAARVEVECIANVYVDMLVLVVVCNSNSETENSVKFIPLRVDDEVNVQNVRELKYDNPVHSVKCSSNYIAVSETCVNKLHVYNIKTMDIVHTVDIHPRSNGGYDIGSRWLAYSACKSLPSEEGIQNALKSMADMTAAPAVKFLTSWTKSLLAGDEDEDGNQGESKMDKEKEKQAKESEGTVILVDLVTKKDISHFRSHSNPLSVMKFKGSMLAICDSVGCDVNVFTIVSTPNANNHGHGHELHSRNRNVNVTAVKLYQLSRGYTAADILDLEFDLWGRWVAVTSSRHTTHIFPIHPAGGQPSVLTHMSRKEMVSIKMAMGKGGGVTFPSNRVVWEHEQLMNGVRPLRDVECVRLDAAARIWHYSSSTVTDGGGGEGEGESMSHYSHGHSHCRAVCSVSLAHGNHDHGAPSGPKRTETVYTITDDGLLRVHECEAVAIEPSPLISVDVTPMCKYNVLRTEADGDDEEDDVKIDSNITSISIDHSQDLLMNMKSKPTTWVYAIEEMAYAKPIRPLWTRVQLQRYAIPLQDKDKDKKYLDRAEVSPVQLRPGNVVARPFQNGLQNGGGEGGGEGERKGNGHQFRISHPPTAPRGEKGVEVESALESAVGSSIL